MLNDTQNAWKSRHETPADTSRNRRGRRPENPLPHCGVVDVSRLAAAG